AALHAVLSITVFVAVECHKVMLDPGWKQMSGTFEIEPAHSVSNVRIDARLPLNGLVNFCCVVESIGCKLAACVKPTSTKASIKFEDTGLTFDIAQIEPCPARPEAGS